VHDKPLLDLADDLPVCASGEAGRHSLAVFAATFKACQTKVSLVGDELAAARAARSNQAPLAQEDGYK
jgi:hypothetical protein